MSQRSTAVEIARRAIVYFGLMGLVGLVFRGIVLGMGAVMQLEAPHPGLTLAATVLLAVTFDPARQRLQRLANRLVFGHRSSPWEAVGHLSDRWATTATPSSCYVSCPRSSAPGPGRKRSLYGS